MWIGRVKSWMEGAVVRREQKWQHLPLGLTSQCHSHQNHSGRASGWSNFEADFVPCQPSFEYPSTSARDSKPAAEQELQRNGRAPVRFYAALDNLKIYFGCQQRPLSF